MLNFDRSYLRDARYEFVAIADTHYMIDLAGQSLEFESRRSQSARADYALAAVAALDTPLVIHMGDLVQEFPERPGFPRAVEEACAQLARHDLHPRVVAGNHDVGDKPDPTMPTEWVSAQSLADHHTRFGRSWFSWDEDDLHLVVLNSQIMNSSLPEAAEQQSWFEADLAAHAGKRLFVFLHLPPFLCTVDETALGHYDNIDEPARSWLLDLVRRYDVELLMAAHVHWSFFNQIGDTDYYTVPSVAFTRPGFGELFSSAPAAEQGRDDAAKLGFFLVRVYEDGHRVHLIHTAGRTLVHGAADRTLLLTRTSADLPASPLGIVLRRPLANQIETPLVWPSLVRQPVRNDYPLLSARELGVRHLRVPASDLHDPLQRERINLLRADGVQVTATWLWRDGLDLVAEVERCAGKLDVVEVQFLGAARPDLACLRAMESCAQKAGVPMLLSCAIPGRNIAGKQHSRTQVGYRPDDLAALNRWLAEANFSVDRALCRVESDDDAWQIVQDLAAQLPDLAHIAAIDLIFELTQQPEQAAVQAATLFLAAALLPESRLFFEPFVDLDRTMDVTSGLLDRLNNPRPVFHLLRNLNTLLFSYGRGWQVADAPRLDGARVFGLRREDATLATLIVPQTSVAIEPGALSAGDDSHAREMVIYDLVAGTSEPLVRRDQIVHVDQISLLVSRLESLQGGQSADIDS